MQREKEAVEKVLELERELDEKWRSETEIEELKCIKQSQFIHMVTSF